MTVVARTNPSLALVKYWGKSPGGTNLPATSSLAVSLGAFSSTTRISFADSGADTVVINGEHQPPDRFAGLITNLRGKADSSRPVHIESTNNFPTAAGLASSSSGLAALTLGMDALLRTRLDRTQLSAIARLGSGSAARAVYGGFTVWQAGSEYAEQLAGTDHWPDLRVLIVILQSEKKNTSSREGMDRSRTSPYYDAWLTSSPSLFKTSREAVMNRELERLGPVVQQSYLRMFGTMFTSDPPLIYWLPESLAVIRCCETLRSDGVGVWETMDAGPQVKLILEKDDVANVRTAVRDAVPGAQVVESAVGGEPSVIIEED